MKTNVRDKKLMFFTAICAYSGKNAFAYFSVDFTIENWADLEKEGRARVIEAWDMISPHPAPEIIKFEPGSIHYVPDTP